MEEKKPISHTSFWGGPDGKVFLGSARITTVRREGTTVFVRTLRSDEDPETADPPMVGDHLVFEPGAISIGVKELDKPAVAGRGGYAPVSGTVWRCNGIVLAAQPEQLRRRLFELARKLDAAFVLWSSVMEALESRDTESSEKVRLDLTFNALALTEEIFVPLAQALRIIRETSTTRSLPMPVFLKDVSEGIISLRNKLQHTQMNQQDKILARGIIGRLVDGEQVTAPGGASMSLAEFGNILTEARAFVLSVVEHA